MQYSIDEIPWQQTIVIRHRVLWPQKPPVFCQIPEDNDGKHFGVFFHAKLISVASIYLDDDSARLRKLATLL